MKRTLLLILALLTFALSFVSCASEPEVLPTDPPQKQEQSAEKDEAPKKEEPQYKKTSALTGLPCPDKDADLRPVAFAVNNEIEFLPEGGLKTVGLSNADVIFETNMEANGSGTRLLPLFSQSALKETERIGSIRSARPYFIHLALMADAYYCHDGASSPDDCYGYGGGKLPDSEYARWMLYNSGIDRIGLSQGAYGSLDGDLKDKIGTKSIYNTLCAHGPEILKEFKTLYPENTYDDTEARTLFSFGENKLKDGIDAKSVKVIFSYWNPGYTACDFVYDEKTKTYEKGQYVYRSMNTRSIVTDVNNGKTLTFTNVFVLFTNQYAYDYDVNYGKPYHIKIDLLGYEGEGYYFSQGKYIPITWKCSEDTDTPIRYYTMDGKELKVNPGKSYVNLVQQDVKDQIEIK